jgi:recombination protein RecR
MNFSSKLLEEAVNELSKLPGIGRRTALRLSLHLLRQPLEEVEYFSSAILSMRQEIKRCRECQNISDTDMCEICSNPKRDSSSICVVQDTRDVMAIENTGQYTGMYLVLGGIISPMDGIGPDDLNITTLVDKVQSGKVKEVIFALPATVEGDTTGYYLFKLLNKPGLTISVISRGVAVGDDIEFTDEVTLGRSIINRTPYKSGKEEK